MKTAMTLAEIADLVGGEVRGEASRTITAVAPLHLAEKENLTWVSLPRHRKQLGQSRAGAVLVERGFGPTSIPAVLCESVDHGIALVMEQFAPPLPSPPVGIPPSACVAKSAVLGRDVALGPNVVIESGAAIGDRTILHAGVFVGCDTTVGADCRLWHNVVVRERCQIGDRVEIHPNTVIGADGFGYYLREGRYRKIPHLGGVIVGDDVEIGACSCVDRSKTGNTVIGPGTKIDNLVQVAHNVEIGAHGLLCAQAGIAGSTRLGNYVVLGGQVGIRDNIVLHDQVMVAACSCVPHDVEAGARMAGIPAIEGRQFLRESACLRKLPGLLARVDELAKRVKELEAATDHKPDG